MGSRVSSLSIPPIVPILARARKEQGDYRYMVLKTYPFHRVTPCVCRAAVIGSFMLQGDCLKTGSGTNLTPEPPYRAWKMRGALL